MIDYLTKTGQFQHFKLSPQNHYFFYKVFFMTGTKVRPQPQPDIYGRNFLIPPTYSFFSESPLYKTWDWKLPPPAERGADTAQPKRIDVGSETNTTTKILWRQANIIHTSTCPKPLTSTSKASLTENVLKLLHQPWAYRCSEGRKIQPNCCECKQMPSKHLLVQIPYFSLETYSAEHVLRLLHQTWSFRYWEVK